MPTQQVASRIKRINGKYYDFGTPNRSFKRVAVELNKLGIKNCYFMLEVKDPRVTLIDPYAPNITTEQITICMTEICRNPWYYLREIARIPEAGGTAMPYQAHRGNIAQAWCAINGYDSDLDIPRQTGKTQSAIALSAWAYLAGTSNTNLVFFNKDQGASKTNLDRLKSQLDILPVWMRTRAVYNEEGRLIKEKNNALTLYNPVTGNGVVIKGHASSIDKAMNIARGESSALLYFDEIEWTEYCRAIIQNSAPVYTKSAAVAKANGAPYWRIFTSTPGDLDTKCGKDMAPFIDNMPRWTDKIYDMTEAEVRDYMAKNGKEQSDILYIEFSYKQLGLTEEWFDINAAKIGDPLTVKREILLQRLRGSDNSPFTRDDLDYLFAHKKEPLFDIIINNYRVDFYAQLDKYTPYIVGIDCSTGTNSDNNAMTIVDPYTLEVVGEFSCGYIGETDFESFIIQLVEKHLPRAIVCIERNHVGDSVIDHLIRSRISSRLYYDRNKDILSDNIRKETTVESALKKQAAEKTYYGVYTEGGSRDTMMSILMRMVYEHKDLLYTRNLVEDLCSLIRKPNGRIEAGPGSHDDSVMSYLIAMYVYYHGNNLDRFGFIKGSQEIQNPNQGLFYDNTQDLEQLVPQDVVKAIKARQEADEAQSFNSMYATAMAAAKAETSKLKQSGLINETDLTIDDVPEYDMLNDEDNISMDFFRSLNNF